MLPFTGRCAAPFHATGVTAGIMCFLRKTNEVAIIATWASLPAFSQAVGGEREYTKALPCSFLFQE